MTKIIKAIDNKIVDELEKNRKLKQLAFDVQYCGSKRLRDESMKSAKKVNFLKKLNKAMIKQESDL